MSPVTDAWNEHMEPGSCKRVTGFLGVLIFEGGESGSRTRRTPARELSDYKSAGLAKCPISPSNKREPTLGSMWSWTPLAGDPTSQLSFNQEDG